MELILVRAIDWFADVIIMMMFIEAIASWFAGSNELARRIYYTLESLTEPFVAPCRKLLSGVNTGMFDWSFLLSFFFVRFVARVLIVIVSIVF